MAPLTTEKLLAVAVQATVLPVLWVVVVVVPVQPAAPAFQPVQKVAFVKSWLVTSSAPIVALSLAAVAPRRVVVPVVLLTLKRGLFVAPKTRRALAEAALLLPPTVRSPLLLNEVRTLPPLF